MENIPPNPAPFPPSHGNASTLTAAVEYTISEDRAAGDAAHAESGFARLAGARPTLANTSQADDASTRAFHDHEVQLMLLEQQNRDRLSAARRSRLRPLANAPQAGGTHALQDYQMQLMLLEQQNKKRVMLARQEQDSMTGGPPPLPAMQPGPMQTCETEPTLQEQQKQRRLELTREARDKMRDAQPSDVVPSNETDWQMQLDLVERQNKRRLELAREEQDRMTGSTPPPAMAANDVTDIGGDGDQVEAETVTEPGPECPIEAVFPPGTNQHHVALYRVVCTAHRSKCQGRIYQGQPSRKLIDGELHLAHDDPVVSVTAFLSDRQHPIAFIVYHDVHCDSTVDGRFNSTTPSSSCPQPLREVITVISGELHVTLQKISKFAQNHNAYIPAPMMHNTEATNLLSRSPSDYTSYFLYHHRDVIREAACRDLPSGVVTALWQHIMSAPRSLFYEELDTMFNQGEVSAEALPWLYRPNEVLVCKEGSLEVAYVLRSAPAVGTSGAVELDCWNWGYDGTALRRKDRTVKLAVPTFGTVPFQQLSAYPLRYASDATKQRLLERGRRFGELRHQIHVSYEGPDYKGERVYPWDSRCVIDYQMYRKFHAQAEAFMFLNRRVAPFDKWPEQVEATAPELDPVNTMLLPPGIHGFFLKDKKWVHLLVDNVAPVNWNKEAYDRLVLAPRIKNLVKALVLVRKEGGPPNGTGDSSQRGRRSDLIRGKGGGLIMLLHGGPGTGKTLTAGIVAELAEMPLYNVTCGDVGTKPEAVEKYLNSVLHLGQKWNCVLLLDEADVFLEQRSLSDLKRNSLVSVFLRTLEYYNGILILTSNRVGTFDSAFKSRIQVALHYPPLDAPSRTAIWFNFLGMLRNDNEDMDYGEIVERVDELAAHEMNGRQIRNAVTTARQLALFEGVPLGWGHVEMAMGAAADFDGHLRRVGAMAEEDWVMEEGSVVGGGGGKGGEGGVEME